MRKLVYLIAFLLFSLCAFTQERITGQVVKSTNREPLIGASVTSKRSSATTDSGGRFTILAAAGDELTISYIGMRTSIIKVKGSQSLSVEFRGS